MATMHTLLPSPQGPANSRDPSSCATQTLAPDSEPSGPQPKPTGRVATGCKACASDDGSATCTSRSSASCLKLSCSRWPQQMCISIGMHSWQSSTPPAKSPGWPCRQLAGPGQPPVTLCHHCHPHRRRLLPPPLHHHQPAGQVVAAARGLSVSQCYHVTAAAAASCWLRARHASLCRRPGRPPLLCPVLLRETPALRCCSSRSFVVRSRSVLHELRTFAISHKEVGLPVPLLEPAGRSAVYLSHASAVQLSTPGTGPMRRRSACVHSSGGPDAAAVASSPVAVSAVNSWTAPGWPPAQPH